VNLGNLFGSGGGSGGGYKYTTDGLGGTLAEIVIDKNTKLPSRGPFDSILDKSGDRYSGGYSGGGSPFSGENALKGFKSLLDVSNAMGDRRQGSYQQNPFGNLFAGSRGGAGGMQLSSGPFGTTTYFPDSSSLGGGGYGGGGKQPSRFAKVAGGAASGALAGAQIGAMGGPIGMGAGAIIGGLGGLFG